MNWRQSRILLALAPVVITCGCKEIEKALGLDEADITGSYTLQSIEVAGGSCVLTNSTTGCVVTGPTTESAVVKDGSMQVLAAGFTISANGINENGTNKHYTLAGDYTRVGNEIRFTGGGLTVPGTYDEPGRRLTLTVSRRLFLNSAAVADVMLLAFKRQ